MRRALIGSCQLSLVVLLGCGHEAITCDDVPVVGETVDSGPIWSPIDSATIVYTHHAVDWQEHQAYGDRSIWVVDLEASEEECLTRGTAGDWSQDGSRVVFDRDGTFWIIDLDTREQTNILDCSDLCGSPRFSPLNEEISYLEDGKQSGTWILNLESGEKTWISHEWATDWSPTGDELICDSLIIISRGGDRVCKIPYPPGVRYPLSPRWSQDGETIAFVAELRVWMTARDGSEAMLLAEPGLDPAWSHSGRKIAYVAPSRDGRGTAIWVMDSNGANKRQVTFP